MSATGLPFIPCVCACVSLCSIDIAFTLRTPFPLFDLRQVRAYAQRIIHDVLLRLGDMTPCVALYDGDATPVERPGEPVLCLQEFRVHKCHRTSRRVRGGKGLWASIAGFLPFNYAWAGSFVAPRLPSLDPAALVDTVVALVLVRSIAHAWGAGCAGGGNLHSDSASPYFPFHS